MSKMKKTVIAILAAAQLLACTRPYEEDYPELKLSATEYQLSTEGGSFQFMVYYSGTWTVNLRAEDPSWVLLSRNGADGKAYVRVTYDSAESYARAAFLDVDAGKGGRQTITLNQKASK